VLSGNIRPPEVFNEIDPLTSPSLKVRVFADNLASLTNIFLKRLVELPRSTISAAYGIKCPSAVKLILSEYLISLVALSYTMTELAFVVALTGAT
jgi:hypothetical protein